MSMSYDECKTPEARCLPKLFADHKYDAIYELVERLALENHRMRDVLRFYADEGNWKHALSEAEGDHGMRAAFALGEHPL